MRQGPDGSWPVGADIRPPLTTTPVAGTALVVRALREFAPHGYRAEMDERIVPAAHAARRWDVVRADARVRLQPYFETGFPHGRSQFISMAATSWASIALTYTVDEP